MSQNTPNSSNSPVIQSKPVKLDKIDLRIIQDLQANGRITNVELAHNAGISAPPCLRRVRNLEEAGLILSYHARVNASALGYPMIVFTGVKLKAVGEGELKKFELQIEKWNRVREAYMMTGDYDFMLKIVARDWDDYQNFLTTELLESPNVGSVKSSLSIKTSKYLAGVPVGV
jgi:DNA-binding Lrp family transcriptional regulator